MENLSTFLEYFRDFNFVSVMFRIFLATVLSMVIGFERGRKGRAAGLRTHILVCLGATLASMVGLYINQNIVANGDVSRIAAQVISGIGFLGAGTILIKNGSTITGLTTAACVWATGTIGICVGFGFYEAAIVSTIVIYFAVKFLGIVEHKASFFGKEFNFYIEFIDANQLNDTIFLFKEKGYFVDSIELCDAKTKSPNAIGTRLTVKVKQKENVQNILEEINKMENVAFAIINYSILI
jgi:putative Mg2+ transporter-C (MgtC) family protein